MKEHRESGIWWKRRYIGPHTTAQKYDPEFFDDFFGEPELWHFDAIACRRRSRLRPLLDRALDPGVDPMELVRLDFPEATPADVERFWNELVPLIAATTRDGFDALPDTVKLVEERFTRKERRVQYRLLARFGLILVARLEPLFHHRGAKPLIPVRNNFELSMLAHHIVGCGRDAYLAAVRDPASAASYAPALTVHTGLYALSVFRFDAMTFDAQKLRLLERYLYPHDPAKKRELNEKLKLEDTSKLTKGEHIGLTLGR
jgi:hypothetical protein